MGKGVEEAQALQASGEFLQNEDYLAPPLGIFIQEVDLEKPPSNCDAMVGSSGYNFKIIPGS